MNDLYKLVRKLKKSKRNGWLRLDLESDTIAEHSYGTVVLGWVLAQEERVDVSRVIEMLLVHDLVMAKIEDVIPQSGKYEDKPAMEKESMSLVAKTFPDKISNNYEDLFREFQEQKSPEAIVAREADKLETLMQAESYEIENNRRRMY